MRDKDKVIIFGLGGLWEKSKSEIEARYNIVGVTDNNLEHKQKNSLYIFPNEISMHEFNYILIVSSFYKEIKKQLIIDFGIKEKQIKIYKEQNQHSEYVSEKLQSKPIIHFLVLWVGTKCSLKCKCCGNLIPYLEHESYNMDNIILDIKRIVKLFNINLLSIQGGEPFTHAQFNLLIDVLHNIDNINKISIATNGTLEVNKSLLEKIKNNKRIEVKISNYRPVESRQTKFYEQLQEYKIPFERYYFYDCDNQWSYMGMLEIGRNNDDKEVQDQYESCVFRTCLSLIDGKLFGCSAGKGRVDLYNIDDSKMCYLDIQKIKEDDSLTNKMQEYISRKRFKEYCRYCLGTNHSHKVIPGLQLP